MIPELSCCRLMVFCWLLNASHSCIFGSQKRQALPIESCWHVSKDFRTFDMPETRTTCILHPSVCVKSWRIKFNQIDKQINYFTIICLLKCTPPPPKKKKKTSPPWPPTPTVTNRPLQKGGPTTQGPDLILSNWDSMKLWPPKPGLTDMMRTKSTSQQFWSHATGNPQIRIHGEKKKHVVFPFGPHEMCWIFVEWFSCKAIYSRKNIHECYEMFEIHTQKNPGFGHVFLSKSLALEAFVKAFRTSYTFLGAIRMGTSQPTTRWGTTTRLSNPSKTSNPGTFVGTSVKTYSICDSGVPGFKTTPAIHPIDLIWFKVRCKWMVEVAWGEVKVSRFVPAKMKGLF